MEDMAERVNETMRNAFAGVPELPAIALFPAVNVSETKDEFTITAELPGLAAKDVSIDYTDGVLTIKGEKEETQEEKRDDRRYYMWERRFGAFQRAIPFPGGIVEDKIAADFKDGVLAVHLPKAEEAKAAQRKIPIAVK
jgi:HSP20 family protein